MAEMSFTAEFTRADVQRAAGRKAFDRALDYLTEVADLDITAAEITANVRGHRVYDVRLRPGPRGLAGTCSCPQGQEGLFCKHCAAVGLVALKDDMATAARARGVALAGWLDSLSRPELLAELRGLLDADRDLRRRFELRVAVRGGDAAAVRRLVLDLVTPHDDHGDADRYLDGVRVAAQAITGLADGGAAPEAVAIARAAIERLTAAAEHDRASFPVLDEAAGLLLDAHLTACQAAPPDPGELGRYLTGLLGHEELAGPARRELETELRAAGDVDGLVALYAAEAGQDGLGHLRIARALDQAGRPGDALDWAERGLREIAEPDPALVDYLAERYAAAGRAADAVALRRDRFEAEPTLGHYRELRQAAQDAGTWPAERGRARALLSADAERARSRLSRGLAAGPVLIDTLLDDGDPAAAWAAAEGSRAVTPEQWLRLADAVAADRPADALAVYRRAIDQLRTMTGNDVYHRLAGLLLRARDCHQALGTGQDFGRYLAAFRTDQRRKRGLMRILAEHGL
jgi:uncharacterized Zn finger protein